jgi:lipopolysaccharide transport system ATP-binding protein
MSVVIKVENLSKAYQLGEIGTGTISRDLERFWARVRGKENPFLKIGEVNDRTVKGNSDIVWGLKDLDFEIKQGDAVGIIGRNGAGKSTLLKILSRVTSPTTGSVKIKGRVASLLEVGTGFHPELSGRENIYLNGAILGMRKAEIKRKFDEIVDFSGVERYIDTPVKRYSSGMYVRLAFAVAAHLESEILIVDEVLSVGDAEFQKKCLGKMGDVSSKEGRTVLFVSHSMGSIQNMCTKAILLDQGGIIKTGETGTVISHYLQLAANANKTNGKLWHNRRGNRKAEFVSIQLLDAADNEQIEFLMGDDIFLAFQLKFNENLAHADVGLNIKNNYDELITHVANFDDEFKISGKKDEVARYRVQLLNVYFAPGTYSIDMSVVSGADCYDMIENCVDFSLVEGEKIKRGSFPVHVKLYTPSKWQKSV